MNVRKLFGRPSHETAIEPRVLVCSFDSKFNELLEADRNVYARHYRNVDTVVFSRIQDLLKRIQNRYDIVHLFIALAPGGFLEDSGGATLVGSQLIEKCCEQDTKLLWIASDNAPDGYIKGFSAAGKALNLIMTLSRTGAQFEVFLERLLFRVSRGETLPRAWTSLAPQAGGTSQQQVPSCIFFAGRPNMKLRSKE